MMSETGSDVTESCSFDSMLVNSHKQQIMICLFNNTNSSAAGLLLGNTNVFLIEGVVQSEVTTFTLKLSLLLIGSLEF